jgi:type VI secretion system protein ImpK
MHPAAQERQGIGVNEAGDAASPSENLALLYQGLFTGIVRLQAQRQHITDAESFRRRTKAALQEVERDGVAAGYASEDIRDTHFAVIAFLDSVVLHSNDPVRAEWERMPLQEELFGQTDAGVVFFDKLEQFRARRDSGQLADILEVFLLCLLLGFEGRYSGGLRGELDSNIGKLRIRIDDIRGRSREISPSGALPADKVAVAAPQNRNSGRLRLVTLAGVIFTILWFLILKWNLIWSGDQLRSGLF